MAKYKEEIYYVPGASGVVEKFVVYLTKKDNTFFVKVAEKFLPSVVDEKIKIMKVISSTAYDTVVLEYKALILRFYESDVTSKKVIKYAFNYHVADPKKGSFENIQSDSMSNFSSFNKLEQHIQFEYSIKYLVTMGENKFLSPRVWTVEDKAICSGQGFESIDRLPEKYRIIDHTEDLEKWFADFHKHLYTLAKGIKGIVGNDNNDFLNSLSTGMKFLE